MSRPSRVLLVPPSTPADNARAPAAVARSSGPSWVRTPTEGISCIRYQQQTQCAWPTTSTHMGLTFTSSWLPPRGRSWSAGREARFRVHPSASVPPRAGSQPHSYLLAMVFQLQHQLIASLSQTQTVPGHEMWTRKQAAASRESGAATPVLLALHTPLVAVEPPAQ